MFKFKIDTEEELKQFESAWLKSNPGWHIKKYSLSTNGAYPKFLGGYVDTAAGILHIEPIKTINIDDWKNKNS